MTRRRHISLNPEITKVEFTEVKGLLDPSEDQKAVAVATMPVSNYLVWEPLQRSDLSEIYLCSLVFGNICKLINLIVSTEVALLAATQEVMPWKN